MFPSSSRAILWKCPADISLNLVPEVIFVNTLLEFVFPFPKTPYILYPHDHIFPSISNTILYSFPVATFLNFVPDLTCTGFVLATFVPSPSCPEVFPPHAHKFSFSSIAST